MVVHGLQKQEGNLTVHDLYSKDEDKEDLHQLKASQQNKVIQRNMV
jgi:hypothetical protein